MTYVKVNPRRNPESETTPTTQSQVDFALNVLTLEREAIGLKNVHYLRENGNLVGTLLATSTALTRKIGFIAHMDTAAINAGGVNPQVIDFTGGDIVLDDSGFVLRPTAFPALDGNVGRTLITTDGTALLGADGTAGIAEIMTAMAY